MTLDEFRQEMIAYLQAVEQEEIELRHSSHAFVRMENLYRRFDAEERAMADQVLAEWLSSDDSTERYHARVLIRKFRIAAALPALEKRAVHLASSRERNAPDELESVNRLIRDLSEASPSAPNQVER
jgi:hypothetical protein